MKIAAWNCNCNWNCTTAAWKVNLLNREFTGLDVAFLMEYPNDDSLVDFHGITEVYGNQIKDKRGVGLWVNRQYPAANIGRNIHCVPPSEFAFATGYELKFGTESIHFLGLWNYPRNGEYGDTWRELLKRSKDFLKLPNVVIMGDFNHPASEGSETMNEIDNAFNEHGLTRLPTQTPTWYFHKDVTKEYCIDFCAVSANLKKRCKLSTGEFKIFVERINGKPSASDHLPLILEIK